MPETLLRTKLFVPPLRPNLVPRPHLIERLNQGLQHGCKLTLISAPAGFGKTTLVSEWIAGNKRPAAWLSLDAGDNDPTRFLTYLIAALQTITPGIGEEVLAVLQSPQPLQTESILTTLLNEIASIPENFMLVLDDYHVIDASPIDSALTFLLNHLPPQMHLVINTREDPPLPLARYRVRGQLNELRAANVRFTLSEADSFLTQEMGLDLTADEVAALETRTEGWIAGLQMAALAMRGHLSKHGRVDTATFIQDFTGSHRFVLDYLVEEVLQRQPDHIRNFLLQTSILNRLSSPLCNAVTGREDGKEMLDFLERGNLFVVPLDDKRQWYRYHQLFADVLLARLMEKQPNQALSLHQRASYWYERKGLPSDAVYHALAADDYERIAALAERAWQGMDDTFQTTTWLSWTQAIPDELIRARPVLSTQYADALWMAGELEASEARLRDAERWLDPAGEQGARPEGLVGGMVVVDDKQFQALPAKIALSRALIAQSRGDMQGAVKHTELALKLTPEEDYFGRAQATVTLGFTNWASGDLEAAHKAMADWINSMQKVGNIVFAVASAYVLADIIVAQGHLQEAVRAYKDPLQLALEQDLKVQQVTAHLYLGLAMLCHEMGDEEAAAQHLLKCNQMGEQSELADWPYRWRLAKARLEESWGNTEASIDLLDEAKRLYVPNLLPDIRPIEALKARVYVRQGRLARALTWVNERRLSVDDDLSYLGEFEHLILARVLIADYQMNGDEQTILQAIGLLERLLKAAEEGRRMGSVIEILLLQALAHQARDNIGLALVSLDRALALAEPEGYFRTFVDEGPPMTSLLRAVAKHSSTPTYVDQLRKALGESEGRMPVNQHLTEPLSKRELEVLGLLRTDLNGPEIARELLVSLTTVRTHTLHIYSKLGVNSRRAAVRRAVELDLF